ncbi:MAG: Asp-tRNA(Asn)/Glu-tRNA(Gln) amidotransferase subunit GatC [Gammaproteobacteria bacterium]|jgi:aspartyl-tRNA(Asn)/glutamyl-tRNA(Gln) amidotransferase subunit C|nr:Asp-tRNA(Asn)/Glu-tRNA(Gln) amidotransferase GatCAB subunit C [Gammaproteobacteria bacterium]MBQ08632.1 Asp-tRNA(Asn)/Glu-tRNA(Gln) amidotransferase GatCAB subunit C [Gammaproteobacteria bacterium]MDP6147042.1 Asp-tRNA(Asn)/Glu-tRNA(Gln) amidotransferase subunit GatC [Gammaproteobacteria bacterium]HJL79604.1 Asp-tRNA(Asn)/Glu-tRNA(Gln) amidotransferase subunit GatC [Gammaproteobacteria bacterium]HJN00452.1 Asp-tRNA(Asn)/Glu-tRNA(Gln) amidotransferase subunit GatC [Gammaproteobacteria bacteri|tara:strand:+ start:9867 stop:10154 length:288 start_codon:yes stop_codon:yes gene_type:complete
MSIKKSEIEHLCNLSKLNLDEEEQSIFLSQMQSILEMIKELEGVDTGEIAPMAHPLQMSQRLREDEITEFNERDKYQKNTDFAEDGFYKVPKVID